MKIYSIYDKGAERYGNPFVSPNHNVALREFMMACKEPKSPMAMFPNDIALAYLGEFDELNGLIIQKEQKPIILTWAKEYVENKEAKPNVGISNEQTGQNN